MVLYLVLCVTALLGLQRRFQRTVASERHFAKKQSRQEEAKDMKKNESSFASSQAVTNTSVEDFFDCPDEWGIC